MAVEIKQDPNIKLKLAALIGLPLITIILGLSLIALTSNIFVRNDIREINNYEDCIAAGFPTIDTNPPKCEALGGRLFTKGEIINTYQECVDAGNEILLTYPAQCQTKDGQSFTQTVVTNFQECLEAGFIIMESYPRQCRTDDNKLFFESL